MLVQYLVSLGATNFGKSKAKSVVAVNSSKVEKGYFVSILLMESF